MIKTVISIFIAVLMTVTVFAQDDTCPAIVWAALEATDSACSSVGRNQACYGNITLEAETRAEADSLQFDSPGDLADLTNIETLTLKPLDRDAEEWGVAILKIQANLPETLPGQNVTFLLFGDVEIAESLLPAGEDAATPTPAPAGANPMQAFYFRSGSNDAPCAEAPDSGILIQTPEGAGTINLIANEAEIELGSTVYLQAQPSSDLVLSVLEGQAVVTAFGVSVTVPAGSQVRVPLDNQGRASGPPVDTELYDPAALVALPVSLLDIPVPEAGGLLPLGGQWAWTMGAPVEAGCVAGMGALMAQRFTPPGPFTLPDGEFDLIILFTAAYRTGGPPPGAEFSQPEPGVYAVDFFDGGGNGHYEVRVISPVQLQGSMGYVTEGCEISLPFEVNRIGD